jgi:tripartite-type tricarboxylate transporter receptor subunit TctC
MKGSRNTVRIGMVLVSCGVATGVLFSATAQAQSVEAFYKNKQMTMIIPSGEGGGYDAYSRLLARHINRHIPGKPRIITQNMPGASGLRGTNYLYVVAPRDGKTFGATYNTLITEPLLGNVRAKFDPLKFNWIGSTANQYNACMVWHTSSIKSIEDAKKREIKVSTTGMSGNSAKTPLMVNRLLGTKFKVISGYKTTGMRLAVERGEVEGICGLSYDTYVAANPEWLEKKKIRFILQAGTKGVTPLAGVPLLMDSVTDPKQRQALAVLGVKDDVGRPYLFPPGVPDHLVNAARRAFDATMKDPLFKADAGRMRINTAPMNGESIQKAIAAAYAAPKDVVAIAAKLWPPAVKKKKKKKKN